MKVDETVKEKLNKILYEKDLTVNRLAAMSGIMQSTLDSILNGRSKNPTIRTIAKICKGINVPLSEFFADELFEKMDLDN